MEFNHEFTHSHTHTHIHTHTHTHTQTNTHKDPKVKNNTSSKRIYPWLTKLSHLHYIEIYSLGLSRNPPVNLWKVSQTYVLTRGTMYKNI
jgi:hypothetical protein